MTALQVLDACEDPVDDAHGVLGCHCPYCQGYFEVMPVAHGVDIGYLRNGRFEVVITLPAEGLAVLRDTTTGGLRARLGGVPGSSIAKAVPPAPTFCHSRLLEKLTTHQRCCHNVQHESHTACLDAHPIHGVSFR
jgi:hypothetical protein